MQLMKLHANVTTTVGLVWFLLFNGISTFVGYLMPKPSLQEEQ